LPNQNDVLSQGVTQIHHPRSNGFDKINGDHAWAYYCLAYTESCMRNCGIEVTPQYNAVTAGRSFDLKPGRAPVGAAMFFDESFYWPDGHAMVSLGNGLGLTTVTDGNGVAIKAWNENTVGYMGWCAYPGIDIDPQDFDPRRQDPDPPPPAWYVQPNNPYQQPGQEEIGIGGGFLRFYQTIAHAIDPMVVVGYATSREFVATVTDDDGTASERTVQPFERGTLIYDPGQPFPWDVVLALETARIVADP
jgi:hypothetical protein